MQMCWGRPSNLCFSVLLGEMLLSTIAWADEIELPDMGPDGCPGVVKQFTHLVLPMTEMADLEGRSVAARVQTLFEVVNVEFKDFFHVATDGGVEITGNQRSDGAGPKGMFAQTFYMEGCTWDWCLKHVLSLLFGDSDVSRLYASLNTISRFLRAFNRWDKVKPHMLAILKHLKDDDGSRWVPQQRFPMWHGSCVVCTCTGVEKDLPEVCA